MKTLRAALYQASQHETGELCLKKPLGRGGHCMTGFASANHSNPRALASLICKGRALPAIAMLFS